MTLNNLLNTLLPPLTDVLIFLASSLAYKASEDHKKQPLRAASNIITALSHSLALAWEFPARNLSYNADYGLHGLYGYKLVAQRIQNHSPYKHSTNLNPFKKLFPGRLKAFTARFFHHVMRCLNNLSRPPAIIFCPLNL